MTNETEEQSFEDAFDELAEGKAAEEQPELEFETETEEVEDVQLREGQEEEEDEGQIEAEPQPEFSLEERLEEAERQAQLWQHKYNSDLGRQNAYQRKVSEYENEIQQLKKQAERSNNPDSMTPSEWKALQEDYPDIAQGVQSQFAQLQARHQAEIESIRRELQPIQAQAQESYVQDQFRILEMEHPDYREIAQSDSFKSWVEYQPENIRNMMTSQQAGDAAYLLRTYKNDLMPGQQASTELKSRREKQLRQAQTVPQRGGRSRSNMPPEDDFEAAFDFFASK
jgi:hypothetical protein